MAGSKIMEATTTPILQGNILNESIPRAEAEHLLHTLLSDMIAQNFDNIKYASYRTGSKLHFLLKQTNLYLVDIYNMIEAFRENGLNTLDHNTELHESRLEAIVSSIFYALNKRIPTTLNINAEKSISLVTNWLLYAYDQEGVGKIRVLSVKAALSILCAGRQVDKLRYAFSQVSDDNGMLNFDKFEAYVQEVLILPVAVGEAPTFGFREDIIHNFFKPQGPWKRSETKLVNFLEYLMGRHSPLSFSWLVSFQKILQASTVQHKVQCHVCNKKPIVGIRYKCLHCFNYNVCQDCEWRGRVTEGHEIDHDLKEYTSLGKSQKASKTATTCAGRKSNNHLPDYPKEPVPDKTLDMSNIVPPLPGDLIAPTYYSDYGMSSSQSHDSSTGSNKNLDDLDGTRQPRMDDEHKLICRYACKLASLEDSGDKSPTPKNLSELSLSFDANKEQRELIQTLEDKNRFLLKEIRRLRSEQEEATKNAQQISSNPTLMAELKLLRQRKDELEMRMSALQESRRELMVQLEGLMNLLKTGSPCSPKAKAAQDILSPTPITPTDFTSEQNSLNGVNGDISEAFGTTADGRNLRNDLLEAADSVANAMSSLVKELHSEDEDEGGNGVFVNEDDMEDEEWQAIRDEVNQMTQQLTGVNNNRSPAPRKPARSSKTRKTSDDDMLSSDNEEHLFAMRNGGPSQVTTDDESCIHTDDDMRTDDEEKEWEESIKRWTNR